MFYCRDATFQLVGFTGNCGLRILSRLKATYTRDEKEVLASAEPLTRGLHVDKKLRCVQLMLNDYVFLPVDWVFAYVLARMRMERCGSYLASDNVDEAGDCHLGPFSTREFVQWGKDNGAFFGCTESHKVKNPNTGHRYRVWHITLDEGRADDIIEEYYNAISQWAKDQKIDQTESNKKYLAEWVIS